MSRRSVMHRRNVHDADTLHFIYCLFIDQNGFLLRSIMSFIRAMCSSPTLNGWWQMEGCDTILSELRSWWKVKHVFRYTRIAAPSPGFYSPLIYDTFITPRWWLLFIFAYHVPSNSAARIRSQNCGGFLLFILLSEYDCHKNVLLGINTVFTEYKPNSYEALTVGLGFETTSGFPHLRVLQAAVVNDWHPTQERRETRTHEIKNKKSFQQITHFIQ